MDESVKQNKIKMLEGFFELPFAKQFTLLMGASLTLVLGIYIIMWSKSPDFTPLFNQLSSKDSGEVVDALQREKIPFKLDERSGLILVNSAKLQETKMKLASLGLPNTTAGTFNGLLGKESVFGSSQFMERARYIHVLETELEKTIASIDNVKSARVHLAIPQQTTFLKDRREPSASVFVDIVNGYQLNGDQVSAITNLVATSIQGLSAQHVTVIDQNGKLLSSEGGDNISAATKQLEYTQKVERLYAKRIQDLLAPVLGYDRVKAEVTADLDFSSYEETSENFDPNKSAIRSERTSYIQREDRSGQEGGVPGSLSNIPPPPVAAQSLAQQQAAAAVPGQQPGQPARPTDENQIQSVDVNRQATRNFEIDHQIRHQTNMPGKLLRLSVAVVVDDKITKDDKGVETKTPLAQKEMDKIDMLVKDAIGYNQARGDRVTVINSAFATPQPIPPLAPTSILEKPWFSSLLKQLLAAVLLLSIILAIVRPMMRNLTNVSDVKQKLLKEIAKQEESLLLNSKTMKKMSEEEYQVRIKEIIHEDPKKAAQVIKQWVGIEHEKGT